MKPCAFVSRAHLFAYTDVGVYTGDTTPDDQKLFVVERRAFVDLCAALVRPCSCWNTALWHLQSITQVCLLCQFLFMYFMVCCCHAFAEGACNTCGLSVRQM